MTRLNTALIALLLAAAVAVAVVTTVRVVTLPQAGSIRHAAGTRGSALDDLRSSLTSVGITQPTGTIQHLLSRSPGAALTFKAATYWTSADIGSRRDTYLAAGALLSSVLLLSAAVLVAYRRREAMAAAAAGPAVRGAPA